MPDHVRPESAAYRNWDGCECEGGAREVFVAEIQQDPRVCRNCFTYRFDEIRLEWWCGGLGWQPFCLFVPVGGSERHTSFASTAVTEGVGVACGRCGHRDGKTRPLSRERVSAVVDNICETLTRKDIPYDESVLRDTVAQQNTSANQGRQDSHVFAVAVDTAVAQARRKD